jgi:hypothetical protein
MELGTIAELQGQLKNGAFEPEEHGGEKEFIVPPHLRIALVSLKDQLLAAVDRNFEELVKTPSTAKALEKMFVREGATWAGEEWRDGEIDGNFGPAPQHDARWLLTLCIHLSPGSDCLAAVYERRRGAIRRALIFREDDYSSITDAVHALEWTISPPDGHDRFYVVEAHTHPWPSSNWRTFWYSSLVPGSTPGEPKRIAEGSGSAFWVAGFDVKARAGGFSVGFSAMDDDVAKFTKTVVHRWKKTAAGFERVHATASAKASAK